MKHTSLTARQIWGMPLILAVVTTFGLTSALLGDGLWDRLSWVALAAPLIVTGWHFTRRPPHRS
jgi:hypothetical protein